MEGDNAERRGRNFGTRPVLGTPSCWLLCPKGGCLCYLAVEEEEDPPGLFSWALPTFQTKGDPPAASVPALLSPQAALQGSLGPAAPSGASVGGRLPASRTPGGACAPLATLEPTVRPVSTERPPLPSLRSHGVKGALNCEEEAENASAVIPAFQGGRFGLDEPWRSLPMLKLYGLRRRRRRKKGVAGQSAPWASTTIDFCEQRQVRRN